LIGVTLDAGAGLYRGLFGLVIDTLISVRLVTANGEIVEASDSTNPDLFWGLRGAGFNFGNVTSATYQLTKAFHDGQVFTTDMRIPASLKSAYFDVLKTFEDSMPPELAVSTTVTWDSKTNSVGIFVIFYKRK
jgi:FAD/FMN-containing dehydrogenase